MSSIDKPALRAQIRERRRALSAQTCQQAAESLCEHLSSEPALDSLDHIAVFASIDNEIALDPFVARCLEQGRAIYYPRVTGPGEMIFARVRDPRQELVVGSFQIPEPRGPAVDPAIIELFLLPGLAFDQQGGRLGQGGGFYDRFLAKRLEKIDPNSQCLSGQRPRLLGVVYAWQLVEEPLPIERHDIPVDGVATERGVRWFEPT